MQAPPRLRPTVGILLLIGLCSLACAGDPPAEAPVLPVAPALGPVIWELTHEEKQDLVKAGTSEGLVLDSVVVLLGAPLAGTENRQILGSAKVVEVWPDLARVQPERVKKDAPPPEAARAWRPEDQATLEAIPTMAAGGSGRVRAVSPASPTASPEPATTEFTAADLPSDLRGGSGDDREEALRRYEDDGTRTAAIVWVMKYDSDSDVQMKAWRVVRARWRRGTGSGSEHESAAVWAAASGPEGMRVEALNAIGNHSRSLNAASRHLADGAQPVRVAAAEAVHDIGSRTGKRSDARKLLQDRLDVESVSAVRKKLGDWIGDL